jgi:hypothetical protein
MSFKKRFTNIPYNQIIAWDNQRNLNNPHNLRTKASGLTIGNN